MNLLKQQLQLGGFTKGLLCVGTGTWAYHPVTPTGGAQIAGQVRRPDGEKSERAARNSARRRQPS